jgi:hypothetical protein
MSHQTPPVETGGCKFVDITCHKRSCEYDVITWEAALQQARDCLLEYDATCTLERNDDAADVLGAAGIFAEKHTNTHNNL